MDLTAPGESIVVLHPLSRVSAGSGTSFAAPFVSGVAALVWAQHPVPTGVAVRNAIINNVDLLPGLAGWTITGGRLNGFKALASVLTRIQRLQMLFGKLLPGALPPGWNIRTINELLLKELKKMRKEGICGLELDELIEAIEKLPDEMPKEDIDDEILEKLKKIIDQLKECSVRGQIALASDRADIPDLLEYVCHLSNIQESSVQVGWGSFHKNMFSKRGETRAFILDGKTYQKGLDTHAPARVVYSLNGKFTRFQSLVGLWDSGNPDRGVPGDFAGNRGSVRFIVVLDDQQVYDSGVMRWDTPAKSIDIDVSGAQILELRVMDVDDLAYDWSIWADAKLLK